MNKFILIILLSISFSLYSQTPPELDEAENLNDQFENAIKNSDGKALDALLNDVVGLNSPSGSLSDRNKIKEELISNKYSYFKIHTENTFYYGSTVVIMGTENIIYLNSTNGVYRFTNVWVRTDNTWKMSARHVNKIKWFFMPAANTG